MISVSLKALLLLPDAYPLVPEEFRNLMATVEGNPDDRVAYGVVADWCEEKDELDLAEAFRWLMRRKEVEVSKERYHWKLDPLPPAINVVGYYPGGTPNFPLSLAHRIAGLADQILKVKEQL